MAQEENKKEETKTQTFKVIAPGGVTIDKFYAFGQKVELSDKKQIKVLTDQKLIK